MAGVDEQLEVFGRTESAGRRKKPDHLIAPRSRERMLHDRQQLDVGEAQIPDVGRQALGELAIGQVAVAFLGHPRPRSEMHLVDRHRLVEPFAVRLPRRHPVVVLPLVAADVAHDRRRQRRRLEGHRERIGLLQQPALGRPDLELVAQIVLQLGHEQFPHPRRHQPPHRMGAAVPAVEVADDADALGVGGPHREVHPGRRADHDPVRAKPFERAKQIAFAEQVQIEIGEDLSVAVGIVDLGDVPAEKGDAETVVGNARRRRRAGGTPRRAPPRGTPSSATSSPLATSRTAMLRADGWIARITSSPSSR